MTTTRSILITLALLTVAALAAFAAPPQTINYQGYLKNTNGSPVTTATSVRFSLYSSNPARNNPVWVESKSVTPANGVYSTQLGSVTPITAPFDVPYYLGVKVESDSEMALQPLSSSAYALRAAVADALPGTPGSCPAGQFASGVDVHGNATGCGAPLQLVPGSGTNNTADGLNALSNNSTGYDNTANGFHALINNTSGINNTASGSRALATNTTGGGNSGFGTYALESNTEGGGNSGTGVYALRFNTSDNHNTAQGAGALYSNTTANNNTAVGANTLWSQSFSNNNTPWDTQNTAVGYSALYSNQPTDISTGRQNTALGAYALSLNSTGMANTASGFYSLGNSSSGNWNTANGNGTLYSNKTGSSNTASGNNALFYNTSGSYNTASGQAALYFNSIGNNNTAYGFSALGSSTGNFNIALGDYAGNSLTTGDSNIDIGNQGVAGDSNTIRIGTTGIHTATYLVGNVSTPGSITADSLVASGTIIGGSALTLGGAATIAGGISVPSPGAVFFGNSTRQMINLYNSDYAIGIQNGTQYSRIDSSTGTGGFGWYRGGAHSNNPLDPGVGGAILMKLDRLGNLTANTFVPSDLRLKTEIQPLQDALDKVEKLRGVSYVMKNDPTQTTKIGVIAQELEQEYPELVLTDEKGMKSVAYANLTAVLIEAVKGLKAENDALRVENNGMKERLVRIEKQLLNLMP